MRYHVYILKCNDRSLYVGCTNNLEKRIKQHNESKSGAHYTKIRRPVVLVYSETFNALSTARAREAEIKNWSREQKLNIIRYGKRNIGIN
jgi:putative endonuclease